MYLKNSSILVTEKADIQQELYFGITVDGYEGKPVVLVSAEGGMSVEEVGKRSPEKIASTHVDVGREFLPYEARKLLKRAGFPPKGIGRSADILVRLFRAFMSYNALIAEIIAVPQHIERELRAQLLELLPCSLPLCCQLSHFFEFYAAQCK